MLQTDAIADLLRRRALHDLATWYHAGMEVQVTVAADGGERVDETYRGRKRHGWTDGTDVWRPFRVPWQAWAEPRYEPTPMDYDLDRHAEGIGLTGWDWQARVSRWVGFDFDAITSHAAGLEPEELDRLREEVARIPWLVARRSTSGTGLHLYAVLGTPIETRNHREHAALSRGVLALAETCCSFPLRAKVDACGQVLWLWHRRQAPNAYEVLVDGVPLEVEPPGWRQHLTAVGKRRARTQAPVKEDVTVFEETAASTKHVPLDDRHRALLAWFAQRDAVWWWDPDRHMLVCHTYQLAQAHAELGLRGFFHTTSTGTTEQNCFAFPTADGTWIVRRHGRGVQEAPSWTRDPSGWTRCLYDKPPTLEEACVAFEGTETARGGYSFASLDQAGQALVTLEVRGYVAPTGLVDRPATIEPTRPARKGRYVVRLERRPEDAAPEGWLVGSNGRCWERVIKVPEEVAPVLVDLDVEVLRHVVAQGRDAGWYVQQRGGTWSMEPKDNVRSALTALGYSRAEGELLFGRAVLRPWILVNEPFGPEYPGNRRWNHRAAQLAVHPLAGGCPTWDKMLHHSGRWLTDGVQQHAWCRDHGLRHGADYLRCWCASLVQEPLEPLPYLAFYGPELVGKSTFHEALGLLFTEHRGYVKADVALRSPSSFNAELASAVLCVVEEVNVAKAKGAYDRLKDWVTSPTLLVHPKGGTPYPVRNATHWVQCANDPDYVPILPGDTRIVLIRVTAPEEPLPKRTLMQRLHREAPAFLRSLLELELPPPEERLRIPAVVTSDKLDRAELYGGDVIRFLTEETIQLDGHVVELDRLHQRFLGWLSSEERAGWSRSKFARALPSHLPRGRHGTKSKFFVGTLLLKEGAPDPLRAKRRLIRALTNDRLIEIPE